VRTLLWALGLLNVLLVGYLVYHFATYEHKLTGIVVAPLAPAYADSVAVYDRRIADIEASAIRLRDRLKELGRHKQPGVEERLIALDGQIEALHVAIGRLRGTQTEQGRGDAYRELTMIYGKTAGLYYAIAFDTLPPVGQ
jgi:hypothetical protein